MQKLRSIYGDALGEERLRLISGALTDQGVQEEQILDAVSVDARFDDYDEQGPSTYLVFTADRLIGVVIGGAFKRKVKSTRVVELAEVDRVTTDEKVNNVKFDGPGGAFRVYGFSGSTQRFRLDWAFVHEPDGARKSRDEVASLLTS